MCIFLIWVRVRLDRTNDHTSNGYELVWVVRADTGTIYLAPDKLTLLFISVNRNALPSQLRSSSVSRGQFRDGLPSLHTGTPLRTFVEEHIILHLGLYYNITTADCLQHASTLVSPASYLDSYYDPRSESIVRWYVFISVRPWVCLSQSVSNC